MPPRTIGLVAAMPEEIRPVLKMFPSFEQERCGSFTFYRIRTGTINACLIESGMGSANATAAVRALIEYVHPSAIINFGFAGALSPGPAVGDLVLAVRLFLQQGNEVSEHQSLDQALVEQMHLRLQFSRQNFRIHRGTVISTGQIMDKKRMAAFLTPGMDTPVVEMETVAVAEQAHAAGIPFLGLRGISDGADEELGFALNEITDRMMRVSIIKVLKTVCIKPWIIPQLVRLARNVRLAGVNLAMGVKLVLESLSGGKNY